MNINTFYDVKFESNTDGLVITGPFPVKITNDNDHVTHVNGRKYVSVEALQTGFTLRSQLIKELFEQHKQKLEKEQGSIESIFGKVMAGAICEWVGITLITGSITMANNTNHLSSFGSSCFGAGTGLAALGLFALYEAYKCALIRRQLNHKN